MALRGKDLDLAVSRELDLMLKIGHEDAPITNTSVHARLIHKGIIKGGLNTLTRFSKIIRDYRVKQQIEAGLRPPLDGCSRPLSRVKALKKRCSNMKKEIEELKQTNKRLIAAYCEMAYRIEVRTEIRADEFLEVALASNEPLKKDGEMKTS